MLIEAFDITTLIYSKELNKKIYSHLRKKIMINLKICSLKWKKNPLRIFLQSFVFSEIEKNILSKCFILIDT